MKREGQLRRKFDTTTPAGNMWIFPAKTRWNRGVCPFFDMICRKLDGQRSPSLLMREYSVVRGICKSAAALSMFPFASCKACRIKPRS